MAEPANPTTAPGVRPGKIGPAQLRFIVYLSLGFLLGLGLLLAPFTQPWMEWATARLANLCAVLIRLGGGHAVAHDNFLTNPMNGFSIEIRDTCNASNVTLLFWVAILAFPATWNRKAQGLIAGSALIHTLNLMRLLSLFYLGQHDPGWFDFAHLYVWESAMMIATLAIFIFWVHRVREDETDKAAVTRYSD